MANVRTQTLEKVDPYSNADKFYRAFLVEVNGVDRAVFQWGSQRGGRSGGQSKVYHSGSEYLKRLQTKASDGYTQVDNGTFTITDLLVENLFKLSNGAECGNFTKELERHYLTSMSGQAPPTTPTSSRYACKECGADYANQSNLRQHEARAHKPAPSPELDPWTDPNAKDTNVLGALSERALACVSLASVDQDKAVVEAAKIRAALNDELKLVDKIKSYLSTVDMMVDED